MDDFAKVNGIYAKYFKVDPPARVCIAVSQLPKGAKVEIDAIAVVDETS
jgi:2-iminobutanoate/2-iminopropanoate deaminase